MSFESDLRAFATGTMSKANDVVRGTVILLSNALVFRSPVDTGRFRSNWQISEGAPLLTAMDTYDKVGTATISRLRAETPAEAVGKVIFIMNGVYYGQLLEQGWSSQAPGKNAIVGRTVVEFDSYVRSALAGVGA